MKIMVSVSNFKDIKKFSDAGADEFYFGFYDEIWNRKFGIFEEINRMSSFSSKANFHFSEIEQVIETIKYYGKKAYLTLNSPVYSKIEIDYLLKKLTGIDIYKLDGIIAGDPVIVDKIKQLGIPITLSTMAGAYNSNIVQFYYNMGVRRMIFPRDIQLEDIKQIVRKFPNMQFEVFLMRNGCKYSDSNCLSYHGRKYSSMCSCIDKALSEIIFLNNKGKNMQFKKEVYENNQLFTKAFHKKACGICAMKEFKDIGIQSLKIVGRADDSGSVIQDILLVKHMVRLLEEGKFKKFDEDIPVENCLYGMSCYY